MHKVDIPIKCDRDKRNTKISVPAEEAVAFFEHQERKQKVTNDFLNVLANGIQHQDMPDLIVYYKGQYVVYPNVIPRREKSIMVLLRNLTRAAVFGYEPKARKPMKKRGIRKDSTPSLTVVDS